MPNPSTRNPRRLHGNVHPERLGENYDGDYECTDCGEQCGGTFQCGCCGRIVGWCQGGDTLGPRDDVCNNCIYNMDLPADFDWQVGDRVLFGWSVPMRPSGLRWEFEENEYCGTTWLQWNLFDRRLCVGRIKQNGVRREMWHLGQQTSGSLDHCARALVARVRDRG